MKKIAMQSAARRLKRATKMRVTDLGLILGYAVTSTVAILLVKLFANDAVQVWKTEPGLSSSLLLLAVGASLYVLSFLIWMIILSRNELSIVYPLMIGLTLATTTLVSWLILKEAIDLFRLSGILVIFVGIVLISQSRPA